MAKSCRQTIRDTSQLTDTVMFKLPTIPAKLKSSRLMLGNERCRKLMLQLAKLKRRKGFRKLIWSIRALEVCCRSTSDASALRLENFWSKVRLFKEHFQRVFLTKKVTIGIYWRAEGCLSGRQSVHWRYAATTIQATIQAMLQRCCSEDTNECSKDAMRCSNVGHIDLAGPLSIRNSSISWCGVSYEGKSYARP